MPPSSSSRPSSAEPEPDAMSTRLTRGYSRSSQPTVQATSAGKSSRPSLIGSAQTSRARSRGDVVDPPRLGRVGLGRERTGRNPGRAESGGGGHGSTVPSPAPPRTSPRSRPPQRRMRSTEPDQPALVRQVQQHAQHVGSGARLSSARAPSGAEEVATCSMSRRVVDGDHRVPGLDGVDGSDRVHDLLRPRVLEQKAARAGPAGSPGTRTRPRRAWRMPTSPRPGAASTADELSPVISTTRLPLSSTTLTVAAAPSPACRMTLVSASWTRRYA